MKPEQIILVLLHLQSYKIFFQQIPLSAILDDQLSLTIFQAYFMLNILKYIEDNGGGVLVGIGWAIALTVVEVLRTTIMTGLWSIALRSATRLRSACMHLLYTKIFRMADTRQNSIGQVRFQYLSN